MAPFSQAIQLEPVPAEPAADRALSFRGAVDPEWVVMGTPHGGYVLGLLVEAAIQFQSATAHKDPIHVTAHYLRPSAVGTFEIHVHVVKTGSTFTNLTADLFQKDVLKVTTHMIFGRNGPVIDQNARLTLLPPSSYARRLPLYLHPATASGKLTAKGRWGFASRLEEMEELGIRASNAPDHPSRTNSSSIGGGGTEWGSWFGFADKNERVTCSSIPLFVDLFPNLPILLPRSERKGLATSWFPTVTMSIEFKAPIPPPSQFHATRTVGVYSTGKFINDPKGRHEGYVEVWTAPSNLGEGKVVDGWRDNQVCVAIATQMALVIPLEEVNKRADREPARL